MLLYDNSVAKRNIIKVSLTGKGREHLVINDDAKAVVKRVADTLGMKEVVVASRIYLWFSRQDDTIQKGVLGLLPAGYEDEVCRLALERLASGKTAKK